MKRGQPLKRKSRLKPTSKRRRQEMIEYTKLRALYLEDHPTCEVCKKQPATEIHHTHGRHANYLNTDTFMAICRDCHEVIHNYPSWARKMGYLF